MIIYRNLQQLTAMDYNPNPLSLTLTLTIALSLILALTNTNSNPLWSVVVCCGPLQ